jgi:hypothetical protein
LAEQLAHRRDLLLLGVDDLLRELLGLVAGTLLELGY